ncbi:MAG: hypothetical protein DRP06_00170 [Candidatus Aenigmatarchaeota archaeon]|nr:MAG: hypothetical protein DRP06_00170 [Candidatus Aenigmarchaeota archaeon]
MLFSLSGLKIRNSKKLAISGLFILTLICLSVIVLAVNITNISLDGSDISSNNMTQINVSQGYSFNFIINTENQNVSEIFVNTTGSVENISSIFIGSENTNWTSLFENTTNLLNWTNTSNQLNGTAWFGFNFQVPTHLSGEFNFTIYANNGTMSLVNTTQFIARGFTPINITLLSPQNGTIMNVSTFNLTYNVNIQANCTIQVWNGSGAEIDTGNSTGSGLMKFIINEMDNGNYSWNVYCVDAGNSSNEALGNESNWTFTVNASEEQIPVNVTLLAPEDNSTINISYFSLNFTVNIYTNCTKTVWNSSGYEVDSGTAGANGLTGYGLDLSNGNYSWNVFCWDIGNESNNDTGALENWTFIVNASGEEVSVNVNKQDTTPPPYEINSTIQFIITITNDGFENLTEINLTDIYNASYITYTWASVQPNEIYPGQINWISIDNGTPLESGDNITIYVNFTAIDECMETSNVAIVNATNGTVYVSDNWGFDFNIHGEGPGPGPEDDWEKGLNEWQSNIVSPYLIKDQWKLINFSIYREAGEQSCLDNLTIILPNSNFTFNGYNNSTSDNYTFSVEGDELIWQSNQSNSTFFCGRGPENFVVNISSNDSYGSDLFQVISGSENMIDDMNLTIFTTTTFSYNGTIYDINGNPLSGAVASIVASSFGQQGDTILGNFLANTLENGIFNITNVPGLNASLDEGPGGPGGPGGEGSIFYRLTATKYNDSENHYAMYVGPSLPDLPESELRSDSGLNNPEIYLKPAITFHIHVGGHDYRSEPNNTNETCPGPQCPGWEPEFNWTNIGFSYGLKDKKMGFPVSSEFSSNTIERYFSAPRDRNYSLMIFPEASFPIYVDFESINSTCNSTGYDLSTTGVNATCTIKNGTHVIDAIISSAMNLTPLTGKVDIMNLTDLWIIPYRLGAGNMIFDQDILPFNLRQMDRWPKNDTQYDDFYNKSSGEYSVYLPATEAHSDIMLMAFAEKNNTYYLDYFKLSSEGQNFSVSEYNFTLNKLIGGVSKTISSNNISADWNSTVVVNTTAVRFNLINNGCVLRDENAFVDIKMELDGDEYMRMTNSQNGAFTIPLIEGEGIKKLTIYSQSYAPVSAPVSANVLNGSSNTSTIKCKDGECNITLSRFDPFDPDDPNATLSITMDFYKSNSTCDVPNPLEGCNMVGDMNDTKFSPLKAILMGDISLRITSGNISVHYVKTDLLASGPPDAAFSQNSTGSDMEAAWKFGSKGPEIYDEVLISMPYADSLSDKIITVNITLLYDNEFNTIWNASAGDTIENIQNNENLEDYRDYLNNSYEAYLNGTGVVCSETDENLSTGLCYKDMISKVIWIKIPHFSGVGPQVTGTGTIAGEVNFTATKTALNSVYGIGDFVEYIINITNNDDQNITLVNVNDTFNSGYLAFNSSNVTESSTGLGWVCWFNVTNGAVVQPNNTFSFAVNMTAFTLGNNITNSIFVNATQTDGGNSAANASVDINIDDIIPPIWLNNKTNSSTAKTQQSIQFNVTLNDNAAGGYNIFSFNNGTHWTNNTAETWISGTEISEAKTITATRGQIINWYWWFNDSLGNENQTDIWNFTVVNTQPTQPILTYTNNSNTSIQPILRWINATDPDNDPLTHTIYISNNSDFTQINQSSTGNQQYQTIGLTDGIWYWKVNASDNYANTLSEIRQFT